MRLPMARALLHSWGLMRSTQPNAPTARGVADSAIGAVLRADNL